MTKEVSHTLCFYKLFKKKKSLHLDNKISSVSNVYGTGYEWHNELRVVKCLLNHWEMASLNPSERILASELMHAKGVDSSVLLVCYAAPGVEIEKIWLAGFVLHKRGQDLTGSITTLKERRTQQ